MELIAAFCYQSCLAMAALAMPLHDRSERAAARLLRPGILLIVMALHAALLLLASRWQTSVALRREEALQFLTLPSRMQAAEQAEPPPPAPSQKKPAPSHDTQLIVVPAPVEPPPVEQPPPPIDWNAEISRAAKHQTELAAAPKSRALDQHGAGIDFDGGLGPDPEYRPEFGWDHAHTHRIEALEGGGTILWINDRCFIVMAGLIPFPVCGIGKIPARGDLLDHMRDAAPAQSRPNTAP